MRTLEEAQLRWPFLEKCISISELREEVKRRSNSEDNIEGLRSACWKCFLLFQNTDIPQWPTKLKDTRDAYTSLRSRFLRALEHPDEADSSMDPLSDDLNSPWETLRKDELLRQEINQDVDRCMPDNLYFQKPETQAMLLDILFVWAKLNPDTGYRQGMHELLAPILWVVERDAIDPKTRPDDQTNSTVILTLFDAEFLGHDSFTLFTQVMMNAKSSYEMSDQPVSAKSSNTIKGNNSNNSAIIARSSSIMDDYLAAVDPPLAAHLKNIDIVPQVFLMRWIRLLFGREFSFDQVLRIWDRLFAEGNNSDDVDLLCVAMLLRIRWKLIRADYNTALQYLLKFPGSPPEQPPSSLVDDAIFLKSHLDFDGGYEIIKKRTERPPSLANRPNTPSSEGGGDRSPPSRPRLPVRDRFSTGQHGGIEALLNDAARTINTKGERWGVYKAVRDVAGEVRKNVSTIQSRTHSRMQSTSGSISKASEHDTPEDLLRKVDALQTRNRSLARMLEGAVSELWKQQKETTNERPITDSQVEAFTRTIAKVQFVQIYLEDTSLEIPSQDLAPAPVSPEIRAAGVKDSTKATIQASLSASTSTTAAEAMGSDLEKPKVESNPSPVNEPKPKSPETKAEPEKKSKARGKATTRPPLEQSSFSWMLGQGPEGTTPRSTFVSASPFSDHSTRSKGSNKTSAAFLFGDEDDGFDGGANSSTGGARDKGQVEREDSFRLGNIGGK